MHNQKSDTAVVENISSPKDAESQARQLLSTVWVFDGRDDIALPVNPFLIADRLGINTFTANLPDGISGMLVKRCGEEAEIYIHAHDSQNRQRFTCAHELGHYVKRSLTDEVTDDTEWEYVDHRNLLTSQGTDPEEIYANQFAASLLMPREVVEERASEFGPVALAYEFGVSPAAMNFRLRKMGLT